MVDQRYFQLVVTDQSGNNKFLPLALAWIRTATLGNDNMDRIWHGLSVAEGERSYTDLIIPKVAVIW